MTKTRKKWIRLSMKWSKWKVKNSMLTRFQKEDSDDIEDFNDKLKQEEQVLQG